MNTRDLTGTKKAKIPFHNVEGINGKAHRKEKGFFRQYSLIVQFNREPIRIARVCFYSTGSKVYCCLWIFAKGKDIPGSESGNVYLSGSGSAGGGGYCKNSAAMAEAVEKAGVTLPFNLSGSGMVEEALDAIAAGCGYKKMLD